MGSSAEEGGAARAVLPSEPFGVALQASAVAMPALLRLEVLSSSEFGHQFRSELQRGSAKTTSPLKHFPIWSWTWKKKAVIFFFPLDRLCTFLRLKKNSHNKVKGSTWSPRTLSCGITTGQYYPDIIQTVSFYGHVHCWMFIFVFLYSYFKKKIIILHQIIHKVADALLWGDTRGQCV